jgi:hypothetical protein
MRHQDGLSFGATHFLPSFSRIDSRQKESAKAFVRLIQTRE